MARGRAAPAAVDVPRGRVPIGLRERPPARAHLLPAAPDERCRRPTGQLPARIADVPTRIALRTASAAEAIARRTRRPPRVTRYAVLHLSRPWTLDFSRARDAQGC